MDPLPLYPNWLKSNEEINRMANKFVPVDSHQSRHLSLNRSPLAKACEDLAAPRRDPRNGPGPRRRTWAVHEGRSSCWFCANTKEKNNKQSKRKCGRLKPECQQLCPSPVLCELCSGVTRRVGRGMQKRVIRKHRPGPTQGDFWADNAELRVRGSPVRASDAEITVVAQKMSPEWHKIPDPWTLQMYFMWQ